MATCPNGHDVSEGLNFCEECGAKVRDLRPLTSRSTRTEHLPRQASSLAPSNVAVGSPPTLQRVAHSAGAASGRFARWFLRLPRRGKFLVAGLAILLTAVALITATRSTSGGGSTVASENNSSAADTPAGQCVQTVRTWVAQLMDAEFSGGSTDPVFRQMLFTLGQQSPEMHIITQTWGHAVEIAVQQGASAAGGYIASQSTQECDRAYATGQTANSGGR